MPISHSAARTNPNLRRLPKTTAVDASSGTPLGKTEAVLFGMFVFDGFGVPGLPVVIPGSDLAAVALVGIAIFRRPQRGMGASTWLIPFAIILLGYLAFGSMYNDVDWSRRLFRICIMFALVGSLISGRLDLISGLKGLGVALAINALLFYLGMAPNNYGGTLTGFLGDKNVAGLYYCLIPLLMFACVAKKSHQLLCVSTGALAVFLTGSRTALAAYAFALIWIVFARRTGPVFRVLLGTALGYALQYLENNFARVWIFRDREGSDLLREWIEQATVEKAERAPWYGLGLSESYVDIGNRKWFFHDSYLALYVEGGWIMLITIVGIYFWIGLRPKLGIPRTNQAVIVEAVTVALLVCASKLGEVFLSLPGFLLIAYALRSQMQQEQSRFAKAIS